MGFDTLPTHRDVLDLRKLSRYYLLVLANILRWCLGLRLSLFALLALLSCALMSIEHSMSTHQHGQVTQTLGEEAAHDCTRGSGERGAQCGACETQQRRHVTVQKAQERKDIFRQAGITWRLPLKAAWWARWCPSSDKVSSLHLYESFWSTPLVAADIVPRLLPTNRLQ
jgi:hypothetical protein